MASVHNSEWLTRKTLIDQRHRAAGWKVTPFDPVTPLAALAACAVEELQTAHGTANYSLVLGGHVVGVVEAKKLSVGPQNVLVQAERYSSGVPQEGFGWGSFGVPFLYSTNGEVVRHEDVRDEQYRSRQLAGFHTPAAFAQFLRRDLSASCAKVLALSPLRNLRKAQNEPPFRS